MTVAYPGGKVALDRVSFQVSPGENVALVGGNGAGKTTLLLAMVGILPAQSGEIFVGQTKLGKKTRRWVRSRVGLVFQNPDDQLFMPSVYEDIAFGPRNFGFDEIQVAKLAEDAMGWLGIEHLRDRPPFCLSAGEKRLCAIAAVLATQPEYLLFDEPTAFLDPRSKRRLSEVVAALPQGKIIATHDLAFAEELCGRVLILKDGTLVAEGGLGLLNDKTVLEKAGL